MIIALIASVLVDGYALVHYVTHHRTGLATAAISAAGWVGYRWHRRWHSTGVRVYGMPRLAPIGERRPELVAAVRAAAGRRAA